MIPPTFPLLSPPVVSFLTLHFRPPESFPWPRFYHQTFPGLRLFNALIERASCLLPASPLARKLLEGQRQARRTPLSPAQSMGPGMWQAPFSICRMNHPFLEDVSSKYSRYWYYLYRPHHFEPTVLKGSFQHLMLELSSKTGIFKVGRMWETSWAKLHLTEERTESQRDEETSPSSSGSGRSDSRTRAPGGLPALACFHTPSFVSEGKLSSQRLLERLDFHILVWNVLPVILSSSEITFMGHLGKRISSQSIIDKVYIFNNRVRTLENLITALLAHVGFLSIQDYSPVTLHTLEETQDLEIELEDRRTHVQRESDSQSFWTCEGCYLVDSVKQDWHIIRFL